jgi:hypothetical protein
MDDHSVECPACGGSGGGPFGRPGSAWDVETYVCPRCEGLGFVRDAVTVERPLAKTAGHPTGGEARGPGIADTRPLSEERAKVGSSG